MWVSAICFSSQIVTGRNADGGKITQEIWGPQIRANFRDTTREDEVAASQLGYTADVNVDIMACNYSGQSYFRDVSTGKVYDIKRTYRAEGKNLITLTCEARERGKAVNYGRAAD